MSRVHWLAMLSVAAIAGCQTRLNDERTLNLDLGSIKSINIDGPRFDQDVVISMTADADVTIAAYLAKDQKEVESRLDKFAKPDGVLAIKEDVKSANLSFRVPAKLDWIIRVHTNRNAAAVKLTIKGR